MGNLKKSIKFVGGIISLCCAITTASVFANEEVAELSGATKTSGRTVGNRQKAPLKDPYGYETPDATRKTIGDLMAAVRSRTESFKWDPSFFSSDGWQHNGFSVNGMPLIFWTCGDIKNQNASLILSSVHGDEVTPVYFGFRLVEWVKARPEICKDRFIVIAPLVNPDGFLRYTTGTRTNWNKVDLNRNFDTPDWKEKAHLAWKTKANSQRRYYPGDTPGSEPETKFQMWLISQFRPAKILSVHAPLNIMDYDGPATDEAREFSRKYVDSCENLKSVIKNATPALRFQLYGNFPGSLGNFAGVQRGIPTLTAELPTAEASDAPMYFGALEQGTRIFFEYELSGRPVVKKSTAADHDNSDVNAPKNM